MSTNSPGFSELFKRAEMVVENWSSTPGHDLTLTKTADKKTLKASTARVLVDARRDLSEHDEPKTPKLMGYWRISEDKKALEFVFSGALLNGRHHSDALTQIYMTMMPKKTVTYEGHTFEMSRLLTELDTPVMSCKLSHAVCAQLASNALPELMALLGESNKITCEINPSDLKFCLRMASGLIKQTRKLQFEGAVKMQGVKRSKLKQDCILTLVVTGATFASLTQPILKVLEGQKSFAPRPMSVGYIEKLKDSLSEALEHSSSLSHSH